MIIGIDFGTCFSAVGFMEGLTPKANYIEERNQPGIPSLFMYSRTAQKELYGLDCCVAEAIVDSADVVRYIKRTIRENPNNLNANVSSGGKNFTINEIVKKYLTYIIAQAKNAVVQNELADTNIERVTITVPVGISEGQMTATDYNEFLVSTIMEITGLSRDKVHVLGEPVAAAISYLYGESIRKQYDQKQTILVFDLGGGTLDVTIVEHNPSTNEYNIKVKEGDLNLGGNDWDEALGNAILERTRTTGSFASEAEKSKFQDGVVRLKHELTYAEEDGIFFVHNGFKQMTNFTRSEFESVTRHLLDRAVAIAKKAISANGFLGVSGIDKIVLVGGSCNMPQIRKRLASEFPQLGEAGIIIHDPSKAIAKGAAIYAKKKAIIDPNSTQNQIVVHDIASHTYGVGTRRDEDKKMMIYNVLFKGTQFGDSSKIVAKSENWFTAIEDTQTCIAFTVYESNGKKSFGSNANFMDFGSGEDQNGMRVVVQIPSDYHGRAKSYICWVTFELDLNGVLEIIITDKDGNRVGYDKKQIT